MVREIARHTPDLAKLIVNAGGVAAMVDYITEARGNNRLPGIMTLGYIAAFSETLALAVVVSKGIPPLKDALINEPEDHLKAAAAWSLGQIGRNTPVPWPRRTASAVSLRCICTPIPATT